jgi:hypothetical protein
MAIHGGFETFVPERLQQIVDGVAFEGTERIFVVCGDEDDQGAAHQFRHDFEAVHFGHLNIEQEDVNRVERFLRIVNRAESFGAARAAGDDFHSGIALEHSAETFARGLFVIGGNDANEAGIVHVLCSNGTSIFTSAP